MAVKKLIEVALPLEKINAEAAREKSIRHGHPSTLHLWWARRPLAAARAVIWASLVDDPSSHPEKFPTEEAQQKERERLFAILEDLVVWENSNNEEVLEAAKKEILSSTGGEVPELLDPFAGGGAIPLEGQRLGLKVHAHDLNPVAVMINKAMIEIPPRFADKAPVNPKARRENIFKESGWQRAQGLAEDVRHYGEWMKKEAFKKIGHLYPKVKVPKEQGGGEATIIAWIWARTVKCPNPACGCEMPLASSFVLSKKKGKEAWVEPVIEGKEIKYVVHEGACPKDKISCKLGKGAEFKCVRCGAVTNKAYIHDEFINKRNGAVLMAVVAEGGNKRSYISPSAEQTNTAHEARPEWEPEEMMNVETPDLVSGRGYGITQWKELFTKRQLVALTTFSDLVGEAQKKAEADAVAAGLANDHIPLREGGTGARAYGEAVGVYLAFLIDQISNQFTAFNGWNNINQQMISLFSRQAIPMVWDYAECNLFSNSTGSFKSLHERMVKAFSMLGQGYIGCANQMEAQSDSRLRNMMISTDPPYYDNISYADLSDFFYVWLRQTMVNIYPNLFTTKLVPKAEELVASPVHHGGSKVSARRFFEDGMLSACKQINKAASDKIPVTIYYAYKRSDTDDNGTSSSGWETMLSSIITAGFIITGSWPIKTETVEKLKANVNALASSIVLVCRKRPQDAPQITRRNLINTLRRELRPALKKLQESNIAPVDLAQSAIGPGMAVFSRYKKVLEADGTPMSVRSALKAINEELDLYFNERTGDMDTASRFCLDLYTQFAYNNIKYGTAEVLATAKNTSISALAAQGILFAKGGIVQLAERAELPKKAGSRQDCIWLLAQQLTRAMAEGGVEACALILKDMFGSNGERAKELAYHLYTIADRKNWATEAFAYNALVAAWPDIQARAAALKALRPPEETDLFAQDPS